jgi:hypothetical protein
MRLTPEVNLIKLFWGVNLHTLFETIKKIRSFFSLRALKRSNLQKVSKFTPKSFMRSTPDHKSDVFEILTCSIFNLHVRLQARKPPSGLHFKNILLSRIKIS